MLAYWACLRRRRGSAQLSSPRSSLKACWALQMFLLHMLLKEPIGCPQAKPSLGIFPGHFWSTSLTFRTGTGFFLKLANIPPLIRAYSFHSSTH